MGGTVKPRSYPRLVVSPDLKPSDSPIDSIGGRTYLARFHEASALVPVAVAGLVYFSSSAVSDAIIRFCSVPTRFGKELPSMRVVSVLSASLTEYVPKWVIIPCNTALFSSAVPWSAVFAANLGRSERIIVSE